MKNKNGYMNKSLHNDWQTPLNLYNKLNEEFKFDFDPCPLNYKIDGLNINWGASNFINPPYNNIKEWVIKCREEQLKGNLCVLLIYAKLCAILL